MPLLSNNICYNFVYNFREFLVKLTREKCLS